MAISIGVPSPNSVRPQGKVDCHPDSTCSECKVQNSNLTPRERLARMASYNLRHPGSTASRIAHSPIRSLTSGAEAVWSALTK